MQTTTEDAIVAPRSRAVITDGDRVLVSGLDGADYGLNGRIGIAVRADDSTYDVTIDGITRRMAAANVGDARVDPGALTATRADRPPIIMVSSPEAEAAEQVVAVVLMLRRMWHPLAAQGRHT